MDRLDQLLEAEITTLSLREPQPLTLQHILALAPSANEGQLADFLHEELPVRFAQRIKMMEALPDWQSKVSIASVRQMYVTSFKELRLADPREPKLFQQQIQNIKNRHARTNLLVDGFKQYAEDKLKRMEINEWLDRFFALRISTNMLMSQYLQMPMYDSLNERPLADFDPGYNPYRSSVDPQCNAHRIAKHAAFVVGQMSTYRYGLAPKIIVRDCSSQGFPFVPRYLFYILSELLKNSVRATVETNCPATILKEFALNGGLQGGEGDCEEVDLPPITVVVSGDENVCSVRVSDEGGGIAVNRLDDVWSYLYTTADPLEVPLSRLAVDAPEDLRRMRLQEVEPGSGETMQNMLLGSPLAGSGCGLPLSRLYANYLGGSIKLQTLPRYGTDVYIYLNRLGTSSETLPHL